MDFAYREGLFARTVTSIAKSKAEGGDITSAELSSDLEKPADKAANELGEDDSNREPDGPSTEELIWTRTQALLQTRLLHKSGVVGHSLALIVFFPRGTLSDAALCLLNRKRADANSEDSTNDEREMRDTLPYFAQFLEDGIIFHDFKAVISQLISNTQSTAVKHDAEELLRKMEFLHLRSSLTEEERNVMSRTVGPINLAVPIKLDKDGNPITFCFADCDEPVEYDDC
uniref:SERPIN domain-containing protein n=1 Tax=Angiostrongylus cantonensis TaxID=6313 RepID=A0A0K0D716_ANGCA